MATGKPFNHPTDAERAAFGNKLTPDLIALAKAAGLAAVDHLRDHPDNVIGQAIANVEQSTGAVTVVVRGFQTLMREHEVKKAAATKKP